MIGYKGFNSDLTCNGYQYTVGDTHVHMGRIELCHKGFHFCRYPLDVFGYYGGEFRVYAKVRADGEVIEGDDKCVTNRLTVLEMITRKQLIGEMPSYVARRNGDKEWYHEGRLHRVDGPAIQYADGGTDWYQLGAFHRTDGPAIERPNGYKAWYYQNQRHRIGGPAIEWPDGSSEWYEFGQLHRTDGPAIVSSGYKAWFLHGKECQPFTPKSSDT